MTEKYSGVADDRRYTGEEVDITYSLKRCLHARECVSRLPEVFDVDKRPWIMPDEAGVDRIVEVVAHCPTGALHTRRKDGGQEETAPDQNIITVEKDGYLRITGDLIIEGATVDVQGEMRATLCRCGASENKPFCDNTHKEIDFQAPAMMGEPKKTDVDIEFGEKLRIAPQPNGPLKIEGPFEIQNEAGEVLHRGTKTWLCRCGGSANKPFCDSTHKKIGFEAD